jgi:hypothetical protein
MNIAQTIISQIKTLDKCALMAWGAKDYVNMGDGLKFKTSGLVKKKCHVYIKLNGLDLYDVQFFRLRNAEIKVDHVASNIYAEDLIRVIDGHVG